MFKPAKEEEKSLSFRDRYRMTIPNWRSDRIKVLFFLLTKNRYCFWHFKTRKMTRLSLTMCLLAFYSLSSTFVEGQSLMTSFTHTLEVYWESYLTFPNDAKTCKLKKRRSNWIPNGKLKRSASTIPFGFDLVKVLMLTLVKFCNT